jgi:hypothetical protein
VTIEIVLLVLASTIVSFVVGGALVIDGALAA